MENSLLNPEKLILALSNAWLEGFWDQPE